MHRLRARLIEHPFVFGALGIWALALVSLPASALKPHRSVQLLLAIDLFIAVGTWAFTTRWKPAAEPSPWWPPLTLAGISALVFSALDDPRAGLAPLTILPITWLALFGTRRQLHIAVIVVSGLVLSWIAIHAESFSDARAGIMFIGVSTLVGFTVQGVVRERAEHAAELASTHAALRTVMDIAHRLSSDRDVRGQVCDAAQDAARAAAALLMELDSSGQLVCTAATQDHLVGLAIAPEEERSGASLTFRTGERHRVMYAPDDSSIEEFANLTGVRSVLFEPVRGHGAVLGVLVVVFDDVACSNDELALQTIAMLAVEAGLALGRSDLVMELARLADTDQLTNLPNRRQWDREIERVLARAADSGESVCVAIIDLDHFKDFNDTFGHAAGDRLLRAAAHGWLNHLRHGDLLARYGGEEFTVLLAGCGEDTARAIAERLRTVQPYEQTSSVGIAQWDGDETAAMLLRRADKALYEAKADGRDRVVCAAV